MLDHNIEENERVELLLQSLPDSYDQLIIILTNNNPADSLIFDEVATFVLNEESRRKNKENRQVSSQQADALSVTRGRSTERGLSGSHNHGRSKSRSKKNVKCYNCGKKGHHQSTRNKNQLSPRLQKFIGQFVRDDCQCGIQIRLTTIIVVLAMCATFDLHIKQLDVKTTFLHGELEEEIYMLQPEGFAEKGSDNLVCMLNKSLYGLKQAPMYWYKRFDSFIMSLGYNKLSSDHCAYYKRFKYNNFIILLLYMDDMLVVGLNKNRVQNLKAQLAKEFEMKDLRLINKILRMQIHRDRNNMKIWFSQKNYLKKILRRFNMHDCKPISTPFLVNFKLSSSMCLSNKAERKEMSRVLYASAVGSLMFAMICTRPDIAQAVGAVSRYMTNPGGKHWIAVKRILRYIRETSDVALCYGGSEFTVRGYVDSGFTGDLDKRKSTTGYVFTLTGAVVSWVSKLQTVVALSTIEAYYMAATQV
ncbi:Integrase catalytic domain-containing protein [Citrus sinensis]|nr:Integrase catalytic domain-containing protein [Citrus sinensis]